MTTNPVSNRQYPQSSARPVFPPLRAQNILHTPRELPLLHVTALDPDNEDEIARLAMSEEEREHLLARGDVSPATREEYRSRVADLAALVSDDELPGGRSFTELSLYEKKTVLVDHELEYVPFFSN